LKVLDFGAFVELEKGIEGLVHVSEISEEHVEDPRTVLQPGQQVKVQVLHADATERKIGLSIKGGTRGKEVADAQGRPDWISNESIDLLRMGRRPSSCSGSL